MVLGFFVLIKRFRYSIVPIVSITNASETKAFIRDRLKLPIGNPPQAYHPMEFPFSLLYRF